MLQFSYKRLVINDNVSAIRTANSFYWEIKKEMTIRGLRKLKEEVKEELRNWLNLTPETQTGIVKMYEKEFTVGIFDMKKGILLSGKVTSSPKTAIALYKELEQICNYNQYPYFKTKKIFI